MMDRRTQARLYGQFLIEQTLSTFASMLGTMLVAGLGEFAMAGVGLVDSINLVATNVMSALASGVTVVVAQCIGRREPQEAGRVAMQSLVGAVYSAALIGGLLIIFRRGLLGALFGDVETSVMAAAEVYLVASSASLPFLAVFNVGAGVRRATGDGRSPMVGALLTNLVYLLLAGLGVVFGAGLGGICLGLVASRAVSAVFMYVTQIKHPNAVALPRLTARLRLRTLRPVLAVALPMGADSLVFNGCKLLVQVFMAGMGTATLAANAIGNVVTGFSQLPGRAFQLLIVTVTGQAYGQGDLAAARRHVLRLTWLSSLLSCTTVLIYFLWQGPLLALFRPTAEAERLAAEAMLVMMLITPPVWSASFVTPNGLRAMGDARFTMYISVLSMVFVRVLGSWLLGVHLGWGLLGIYWGMNLDWCVRGVCYLWRTLTIGRGQRKTAALEKRAT